MYEELIEKMRCCSDQYRCGDCRFVEDCAGEEYLLDEAADAIERLNCFNALWQEAAKIAHECEHEWIPCSERLPEKEKKKYWIGTDTGYQCECRWTNNQFGIGESDEWGWSIFDIPQYQKVVAWMSLPDPYEPPKEE